MISSINWWVSLSWYSIMHAESFGMLLLCDNFLNLNERNYFPANVASLVITHLFPHKTSLGMCSGVYLTLLSHSYLYVHQSESTHNELQIDSIPLIHYAHSIQVKRWIWTYLLARIWVTTVNLLHFIYWTCMSICVSLGVSTSYMIRMGILTWFNFNPNMNK